MQIANELMIYEEKIPLDIRKQINAIEAIEDNYTGHVKDFTGWLRSRTLMMNEESIKQYFTELNKSDHYTAGTKRVKRQAVKSRMRTLSEDLNIEEAVKMNTLLERLDRNPATKAPKINSMEITRDMYLSPDQIKEVIDVCRSARQKLFIEFLYKTGCRVAEMCSIKLSDCKATDAIIKLRVSGKGDKERFVRISRTFYDSIIEEFHGKKYLMETSGGKSYRPEYVSNQIKKMGHELSPQIVSKSEIRKMTKADKVIAIRKNGKNISAHTLRHSFFMELIRLYPGKIDAISKYGGHSDPSITLKMYCHNQLEDNELMELSI